MDDTNKGLYRSFRADRAKLDAEARTVELAFSSESPIERWGENEVLGHGDGEYDFSRIAGGDHPLLAGHNEHDPDAQIGVVESARVDGDKTGRAIVRFSKSPKGEEYFNDVKDGIRKLVSVGYDRTGIVSSDKDKTSGMVTTRYRWSPTHIAIVPVPADTKAGIGRSVVDSATESHRKHMPETTLDPLIAERSRTKEIHAAADLLEKDYGSRTDDTGKLMRDRIRSLVAEACGTDMPLTVFQNRAMTDILRAKEAKPLFAAEGSDKDFTKGYSLQRAFQSCARQMDDRKESKAAIPDGLEGEYHQEFVRRAKGSAGGMGFNPGGFQMPLDACVPMPRDRGLRRRIGRDMQSSIFAQGGALVPTNLVVPVIELLRNVAVLPQVGIRTMAGLTGNIVIPRQDAPATAYCVPEIGQLTASQQVLGQIAMSPKRVGSTEVYSKQLLLQSTPDAEAFIRDDHLKMLALKKDYLGLNGQGANSEPLGVMNTPGIGAIIFGGTPTYKQMIAMETTLRTLNVVGDLAYVSTPSAKGDLKGVAEALTGATTIGGRQNAIWQGGGVEEGTVNGYLAIDSNQVPNNQMILGQWDDLIEAMWGGLDVVVDIFTKAAYGEIVITFNLWLDYAVRHPQAFIVSADAANQ
jgi:HK97 family phage major capsid protein